jgi:hypothetical protein
MKINVGPTDRAIRIIVAIILVGSYVAGFTHGRRGLALLILGVGLAITGLIRFCGLYALLGMNSGCSAGDSDGSCDCCKK